MKSNLSNPEPPAESLIDLSDLKRVSLMELFVRYVGAAKLHANGLVDDEFLVRKLQQFRVACRAADVMLEATLEHDSPIIAEAAKRFHKRLTRR